jgi:uncharacterized OB-fold protein
VSQAEAQRMEPPISHTAEPYWDATREERLVLQYCGDCGRAIWFPRALCPFCSSTNLQWQQASGRGTVYAVSVQYRPGTPQMKDRVPYAVALVDLEEGVRMLTNVVGCDAEDVVVGQTVRACWEPLTDGRNLLVFEPNEVNQ